MAIGACSSCEDIVLWFRSLQYCYWMSGPPDPADELDTQPRYEAWLAERELLSMALAMRDAGDGEHTGRARIGYEAAWMRFMVALCNLPVAVRPVEVERVLEALRHAHLLQSRGDFPVGTPPVPRPLPSPDEDSRP